MLASLLIVFREVLEAGLIVGIVLAATQGIAGRGPHWIAGGIAAGRGRGRRCSRPSPARCPTRWPATGRRCSTPQS